jgi:glucosamine 6-phosphate synthetase-like amidotransferase/phosphosugar isomerase protein
MWSNITEVKARDAYVLAVTMEGDSETNDSNDPLK